MTILVVEDDRTAAFFLARVLKGLGHEVVAAADGAEAWSLLQRRRFDLVLSDWMMPGSDGLELCRRIRGLASPPYTYVILVTGRCEGEDRIEALKAGADDFLTKPLDPRKLAARLRIAHRLLALQEVVNTQGELERKNEVLRALATTDELTGLKNRRRFFEDLGSHFDQPSRGRSPLSLVLLDVDHFKRYNDAFGHPAGDEVLRGVADALRGVTRGEDTVGPPRRRGVRRHPPGGRFGRRPGHGRAAPRGRRAARLAAPPRDGQFRGRHGGPGCKRRPGTRGPGRPRPLFFQGGGRNCVTHHADLGDDCLGAPRAESRVPQRSLRRTPAPAAEAGSATAARPGAEDPACDDVVGGGSARWRSATARRPTTAAGPPRWCSTWRGRWGWTRPRCFTSAAAPCFTTSARSASPNRSCSSPVHLPTTSGP